MQIERLPTSSTEEPALLACVAEDSVIEWALDSKALQDAPMFGDGTNWYQVWRENNIICVQSTCWFASDGHFSLRITYETPDAAVRIADMSANMATGNQ